jgi:hypothetical protein
MKLVSIANNMCYKFNVALKRFFFLSVFFVAHGCGDSRIFVDRRVGQEEPGRVQGLRLTRSL